jgi:putative inorganic carbon (hco3(-)) transporter
MHIQKPIFFSPTLLSIYLLLLAISTLLVTAGHLDYPLIPSLYDTKRVSQLLLIALCCFVILTSNPMRQRIHDILITAPKFLIACLLAIITLSLISSFQAPEISFALLEVVLFLGLIILTLSVAAAFTINSQLTISVIIWSLLIFATYYEIVFFTSYFASINIDSRVNTHLIFSGFSHRRFFNQYQIWSLPILCLPLLIKPSLNSTLKIAITLIAALWFTILFASTGRGAILSYLLAFALLILLFRSKAIPLLKLNALCFGIGLFIYAILFYIIPKIISLRSYPWDIIHVTSTKAISERTTLWLQALEYIKTSPWLGIGPMHYAYYPNAIGAHPHNSTLQFAAEFGLPATVTIIILVLWFLYKWVSATPNAKSATTQHEHPSTMTLWIAIFFSLLSGLFYSQLSGVIVMPMPQSMLAILIGVMLGMYYLRVNSSKRINPENKSRFLPIMISAGIILTSLTYLVTPQLTHRVLAPFWAQTLPTDVAGPRFWLLGGILHYQRTYESLY